jgi:cytochrome c oxidase subunit 3
MSANVVTMPQRERNWELPSRGHVAMFALIVAESAIFVIFVVAYLFYLGKSLTGPTPKQVLEAPIFYSICLLSSSITIHLAVKALRVGNIRSFRAWWFGTIMLGAAFLYGTAHEWHRLIYKDGLTISTNLFGTTLICLSTVMAFALLGDVQQQHTYRVDVLSLYWHFVDVVWIVVFTVVYIIGR